MQKAARAVLVLTAVLGLAAAGCGGDDDGGGPTGPPGGGTADVTVSIISNAMNAGANAYSPDTAAIQVGQTIRWVNNDAMVHTATADLGSFNTGNIGAGAASGIITITGGTGVRAYHCAVGGHSMQGWVNVTP